MVKYIIKRLFMLLPVVLGITFIIFLVLNLAPGDAAVLILGVDATTEDLEAKRVELGLDKPMVVQYVTYVAGVLRGDFGRSWVNGTDVLPEFLERMPYTFYLGSLAMLFAVVLGIPIGVIAAIKQYHVIDYVSTATAIIMFSLPAFWFGMMSQILFCLILRWLPAAGADTPRHFILPALTLGANLFAFQIRMARTSMLDVVKQDYIRTARAKGAPESRVVMKHILQNGMLPVITQVGISFAAVMGGSVVTETVFSIPGLGSHLINGVKSRDIPVVMGTLIFVALFVGLINLIVDIIYAFIDPRVKFE